MVNSRKNTFLRSALTVLLCVLLIQPIIIYTPKAEAAAEPILYAIPYTETLHTIDVVKDEGSGVLSRLSNPWIDTYIDICSDDCKLTSSDEDATIEKEATYVSVSGDGQLTLIADFENAPKTISEKTDLSAVISITSGSSYCSVSVTVITESSEYTVSADVRGGADVLLVSNIDFIPTEQKITGISVTVANAQAFTLREVYLDTRGTSDFIEKYGCGGFYTDTGNIIENDSDLGFMCDESGTSSLTADIFLPEAQGDRFLKITLTSFTEGNFVSLRTTEPSRDTQPSASSTEIAPGTHTYYLRMPSRQLDSYSLVFSSEIYGIYIFIENISVYERPPQDYFVTESVGKVDSVKLTGDNGTLTLSGTLTSSTVIKYITGKIALFEIPLSATAEDARGIAPVALIDISTSFEFSLLIDEYSLSPSESKYTAAIITENNMLFISEPVCISFDQKSTSSAGSVIGLTNASAVGVFESNSAHVVIDVDIAKLSGGLTPNTTGKLCTYGGNYYYLDSNAISKLDEEIQFYTSAGTEVYFRLLSSEDLSSLSYTYSSKDQPDRFVFNTRSRDGLNFISAIVGYLANRYPEVDKYICGNALNIYPPEADPAVFAQICAENIRLIYNTVAITSAAPMVYIPLAQASTDSTDSIDAAFLYSQITSRLSASGAIECGIYWESSDSKDELLHQLKNIDSAIYSMGINVMPKMVANWTPDSTASIDSVLADFTELCTKFTDIGYDALILSVPENAKSHDIYGKINTILNIKDSTRYTYHGTAYESDETYKSSFKLWDFSSSYNSLGWVNGGGCKSVSTQTNNYLGSSSRFLEATISGKDGASPNGVIICMLDTPLEFNSVDTLSVSMYIRSGSDKCEFKLTLGSGDRRSEFLISAATNKLITVTCDLTGMPDGIEYDYAAIIAKADSDIKLNISHISANSNSLSDEELMRELAISNSENHITSSDKNSDLFAIIIATTVFMSVIIFAVLTHKKKAE